MSFLFILDSLGSTELLVILGAALIFFGPRRLPQLSRQLGKSLSEFRRASDDFKRTWEREVNLETYDKGAEPDYGNSILEKATEKIRAAREAAAMEASPSTAAVAPAVTPIDSSLVQPRDVATAVEPAPPDQPGGKHDWL
jgi:TatA/E family protein of Tat protein translocase